MTIQCCVCKKVQGKDGWTRPHSHDDEGISHTYCPVCLGQFVEQIHAEFEREDSIFAPQAARA